MERRLGQEGGMRPGIVAFVAAVALVLAGAVSPVLAGTICGTVGDTQTSVPVPHAGVFVRTAAGDYTGFYGATDLAGHFCIPGVPAGTYDLEVLVDDYQVAYLRNVIVGTSADVTVPAALSRVALAPPRPNPAVKETDLSWILARAASAHLMVIDSLGRIVQEWSIPTLPAGPHALRWDLRGTDGRRVPAGCYFVVLDADGARRVRSFRRVS
jgi:hypothetical protein